MPSNSLRKLTRKPVGLKAAVSAMGTAHREADDRSAAITAAALTEVAVEKAIKLRLRPLTKTEQRALFDGTAPLATFSAKIRMGYALGIYGRETRHDLESINAIRNVFAHSVHEVSFKSRAVIAKVYGMHKVIEGTGGKRPRPLTTRDDYLGVTRVLWFELVILADTRKVSPPFPAFAAADKFRKRTRSIKR